MKFLVTNTVSRFPGEHGWYFIELDGELSKSLRPILKDVWPGLLKARFTLNKTIWNSSIMPIKDGPMFIALPLKVRKAEKISLGQSITISVDLLVG